MKMEVVMAMMVVVVMVIRCSGADGNCCSSGDGHSEFTVYVLGVPA